MRCFTHKIASCWAFKVFCAQDKVALIKFYLFKDLLIRFKDFWRKFKDFSRTWANFSIFKDFSRGWYFFKDYSRPVRTMTMVCDRLSGLIGLVLVLILWHSIENHSNWHYYGYNITYLNTGHWDWSPHINPLFLVPVLISQITMAY